MSNFISTAKIVRLALPLALTNVIGLLAVLVNTKIIGEISSHYLFILSLYLPLNFWVVSLFESLKVPATVVSAIAHGRRKYDVISEKLCLLYTVTIVGLAIPALILLFCPQLSMKIFLLTSLDNYAVFKSFSLLMLLGGLLLSLFFITVSVFNGIGMPKRTLVIALSGVFVSTVLTWVFSTLNLGLFSLPFSLVFTYALFLVVTILSIKKLGFLKAVTLKGVYSKFNWARLKQLALPIFLTYCIMALTLLAINRFLMPYGQDVVAGFGVAYRIQTVMFLPAISVGVALGIIANQLHARKALSFPHNLLKKGIFICFGFYLLMAAALYLLAPRIVSWITSDPHIIHAALEYLSIVGPSYIGISVCLAYFVYLDQTGFGMRSLFLNTFVILTELICAKVAVSYGYSFHALYWMLAGGNVVSGLAIFLALFCFPKHFQPMPRVIIN